MIRKIIQFLSTKKCPYCKEGRVLSNQGLPPRWSTHYGKMVKKKGICYICHGTGRVKR